MSNMNKVLVKLYVPIIEEQYDVWLPKNKRIYNIIMLLIKGVKELTKETYQIEELPILYNRLTGVKYDLNDRVQDTDITNGTEIILV